MAIAKACWLMLGAWPRPNPSDTRAGFGGTCWLRPSRGHAMRGPKHGYGLSVAQQQQSNQGHMPNQRWQMHNADQEGMPAARLATCAPWRKPTRDLPGVSNPGGRGRAPAAAAYARPAEGRLAAAQTRAAAAARRASCWIRALGPRPRPSRSCHPCADRPGRPEGTRRPAGHTRGRPLAPASPAGWVSSMQPCKLCPVRRASGAAF
eukprot:363879-Chlamydomonas_euryale.AAC.10